jgi:hypothetical protein
LSCIDCHNNSDWAPAGTVPKGPHSSRYAPILARDYVTNDGTAESRASYDLCYGCHDRGTLLVDGPGRFPHRAHVVDQNAPCAACHDAHGSRQYAHLIDFMVRDLAGQTVVGPNSKGRLAYASAATGNGSCDLSCHGSDHDARTYGLASVVKAASQPRASSRALPASAVPAPMPPAPGLPSAVVPLQATPSLRSPGPR